MPPQKFSSDPATGFGTQAARSGGRFYNKDGRPNVRRTGTGVLDRFSFYHTIISLPRGKFFLYLTLTYFCVNLIFACLYYVIGIEHFSGVIPGTPLQNFSESFFFSAQTLSTVGYGRISPVGTLTNMVAAFEAFVGVLSFALASGLFLGRFTMPRAYLRFSDKAIIAPYKGGKALMFRMVPYKNNHLSDAEVKLTLAVRSGSGAEAKNEFFPLEVELSHINSLALNWTIVHPINENSPLSSLPESEWPDRELEFMVFIRAFDEAYANTVIARTSYQDGEILHGVRFLPMYAPDADGSTTLLHLHKLSEVEAAPS